MNMKKLFSYSSIAVSEGSFGFRRFYGYGPGFLFFLLLCCLSLPAFAKVWVLEDRNLKLSFNDQNAALTVLDKRCNKQWEQVAVAKNFRLQNVLQNEQALVLNFTGTFPFSAEFRLAANAELEVTIAAAASAKMDTLSFPSAFKSPAGHHLLLTDGAGLALPVEDKAYPLGSGITYFCGGGLSMAWMGVTDKSFSTGYMAILETPYDAQLTPSRRNGAISFHPVWLASKETFGYHRKLRYAFFNKGGYVAQCKRYREYSWPANNVVSLREKAKKLPAIDRMMGGVHIYVWDNARNAAFAKELKDAGISKAMFLWNPNHPPYPSKGYDDSVAALGFVPGVYELPTDTKPRDSVWYDLSKTGTPFKRNAFPGLYNQIVARKRDGSPYVNQFGHFINPAAVRPHIFDRFNRELALWPHQTYFMDVYQANGLYECWSKENPLTREGWAAAIRTNQQYLIDSLHQFLGAEWGADFCNGQAVYAHGMMTLQRTWWGTEIGDRGTIYYTGDWRNGARPTQMLGTRTAPPLYLRYSINEALRLPLYELVYHDAVVTSWRWEDANHHAPEIWWKKDLFNALYGNAPLWNLDRESWEAFRNTFTKSYKTLHPWLQSVCYDEMVSHRFVTADKKVQESVFSSGKKVVVNFGDEDVQVENSVIPARGFATVNIKTEVVQKPLTKRQ